MNLDEILIFTKIVETGSFTEAARLLELPKSTVSRKLNQLEQRLGVRLLQRTTRRQGLTDIGQEFFSQVSRVVKEIAEAESSVLARNETPQGHLRASVPSVMAMFQFSEIIDRFLTQYPAITFDLDFSDRNVDLIEEGFDVVIRAGQLEDSTMVATRLLDFELKLYASNEYVTIHGTPRHPSELIKHECIQFTPISSNGRWRLSKGNESREFSINHRRSVNSNVALVDWIKKGRGIGVLVSSLGDQLVAQDQLQNILAEWLAGKESLYLVYPTRRFISHKARVFVEYIKDIYVNDR